MSFQTARRHARFGAHARSFTFTRAPIRIAADRSLPTAPASPAQTMRILERLIARATSADEREALLDALFAVRRAIWCAPLAMLPPLYPETDA